MYDVALSTKDLLVSKGLGVFNSTAAFSLFVGAPPDKPDALVLINVTGGRPPLPHLALNYPSIQVMVRGAPSGYAAASARMSAICNALLGISTYVLNGDTYRACNQIGDVIYLGQDDNTRPLLSANFRYIVEPAIMAGGNRATIS